MAAPIATLRIEGIEELRRKLTPAIYAPAATNLLNRAGDVAVEAARGLAREDRKGLKGSIGKKLDPRRPPRFMSVGTDKVYAAAHEFGLPPGKVFPPPAKLEDWARRHGFPPGGGFLVARAIFRRGLKAKPYLRPALDVVNDRLAGLKAMFGREIEAAASKGVRQ